MIDSLKLYETLKSANLSEAQARAITAGVETALGEHVSQQEKNLAQKVNTARFETEMHQIETSLANKVDQVEASLCRKIEQVETKLNHKIDHVEASLKHEMHQIETVLNQKIDRVEGSLRQEIQGVKTAIAETKFEML